MPHPPAGYRGLRTAALAAAPVALSALLFLAASGTGSGPLIFLPGTQPGTVDTLESGDAASACATCHSSAPGRDVPIQGEWAGSMMAHSARNPFFRAALAVTNRYAADAGDNTGEYCIRCHSPTGWLAGRSEDVSGRSLRGTDLDGVQCAFCHRAADPLAPDSTVPPMVLPVPGYGNGMFAVQAGAEPLRGPRDDAAAFHPVRADSFQSDAAFCGVCHDVSNPFHTAGQDRLTQPPHSYAPLERTYSEWLLSAFAAEGPSATCQGCHMTPRPGYASSVPPGSFRDDVRSHDLTGGNTFIPRMLPDFWPGLDTAALAAGAARAAATLRRAASIGGTAVADGGAVRLSLRVTNLTGHKLPTGYPEGRRIWLTVVGRGPDGDTLFRSGWYDAAVAGLTGDSPPVVYETIHGMTDSMAAAHGMTPGPSFHFSLNDTVLSDNRIPPRGFANAPFAARGAAPVGKHYPDGVHWDDPEFLLPPGTATVSASLWYQTITREYAEFLRDENEGNPFDPEEWGRRFFEAWERHGKSPPALIDSLTLTVTDTLTGAPADPDGAPASFRLEPAWPNPFNGRITFRYRLPWSAEVRLTLADPAGRTVATIDGGRRGPGEHQVAFSADGLPSGAYFVRLTAGGRADVRKILLLR